MVVKSWVTEAGFKAWIVLIKNSHHCGYVEIPAKWSGVVMDEENIEVHGGITYQGRPGFADGAEVVGYDCAHAGDAAFGCQYEGDVWRDVDFCTEQCELLARQL